MNYVKYIFTASDYNMERVVHASYFINNHINNITYNNNSIIFYFNKIINKTNFLNDFKKILKRYHQKSILEIDNEILFKLNFKKNNSINFLSDKILKKYVHQVISGVNIYSEPFSSFIAFLDYSIKSFFKSKLVFKEELYPNFIEIDTLNECNHFDSFPEHVLFNGHFKEGLFHIDKFSKTKNKKLFIKKNNNKINNDLVQNPSTCFHFFKKRGNQNISKNEIVTAISKCGRFESKNHKEITRLREFFLREFIFIGSKNFVDDTRFKTLDVFKQLISNFEIPGIMQSANDPFFTQSHNLKSSYQKKLKMKYEFKANIQNREFAIFSSNYHGLNFSKNFKIKRNNKFIHSGCIGFGLERFAYAFFGQHGYDNTTWPKKINKSYLRWKNNSFS